MMRLSIRKLKSNYQRPINNMLRGTTKIYNGYGLDKIQINTIVILFVNHELSYVTFHNVSMWHKFVNEILKNEHVRAASLWTNNHFTLEEKDYIVVKDVIDHMLSRYIDINRFEIDYDGIMRKEWGYLEERNRFKI